MIKFNQYDLSNYKGLQIGYSRPISIPVFGMETPLLVNKGVLNTLGINSEEERLLIEVILNKVKEKGSVWCLPYGGTQYGQYRVLGDGRSGYVGRVTLSNGLGFDINMKGIGLTNYSRGNGKCSREEYENELIQGNYLCAKGIDTSRVLCGWKDKVLDGFVYIRLTKSLMRVGSFEYFRYENMNSAIEAWSEFFMEEVMGMPYTNNLYLMGVVVDLYRDVLVKWLREEFCHGRLNTDNVLLCGWAHDYVSVNTKSEEPNMYSLKNQKYALALSMECLGKSLGLSDSHCSEVIHRLIE